MQLAIAACSHLEDTFVWDIWFQDLYNKFYHVPHFPHYCTLSIDTVPIPVCGGEAGDATYQPKYAEYDCKVTTWRTHLVLIASWAVARVLLFRNQTLRY